jgi:hypothetical protein
VVALLLGGLLALFATSGPAVAFFSGGLFLDVQVDSPARLLARGAAIEVPLEVTCNAVGTWPRRHREREADQLVEPLRMPAASTSRSSTAPSTWIERTSSPV